MASVAEPCCGRVDWESSEWSALGRVGDGAQCHGKGKFEPARVELDLNVLRVGIAVGSTLRLTVRAPKSKRKGQPHAFRVDLGEKDRTGVASGHYAGVAYWYDQRMDGGDGGGGGGGG